MTKLLSINPAVAMLASILAVPCTCTCVAAESVAAREPAKMSAQIRLVEDYNHWVFGPAVAGNEKAIRAGLPKYITNATVLHEAPSLPWGGTMIGYDGWIRLVRIGGSAMRKIEHLVEISSPQYYQNGPAVLREVTMTIKGSPAAPEPFVMGVVEKYTVLNGRITQVDEFYGDTAGLLARMKALGAIDDQQK